MKKKICIMLLLAAVFFLGTSLSAHALPIWGSDASGQLNSSRTSLAGSGVDATQQWDDGNFTIGWDISQGDDNLWTYIYNVTADTKDLSHLILEVTEDDAAFNIYNGTSSYETPLKTWSLSPSNPLMPNSIYGVKFDFGDTEVTYTMVTDRAPVYGVFYTKDGKDGGVNGTDVVAWSNALNFSDYKTNEDLTTTDFIARPDGGGGGGGGGDPIPEPATMLLLGTGLVGFALNQRKKFKK